MKMAMILQSRQQPRRWRRSADVLVPVVMLAAGVGCLCGCGGAGQAERVGLAAALGPMSARDGAALELGAVRAEWPKQSIDGNGQAEAAEGAGQGDGVVELVLSYVSSGRDFQAPAGPDGYVLRVLAFDKEFRPVQVAGDVSIGLFEQGGVRPVRVWYAGVRRLGEYWLPTRLLDGYVFRLGWGESAPVVGNYVLFVRLRYRDGDSTKTICQEISFQDAAGRKPTNDKESD